MIDPSMTDILLESSDAISLPMALQKIEARDQKIAELQTALEKKTEDYEFLVQKNHKHNRQVGELEDFLKENHSYMDSDHVEEIAGIFDISLEKDYDVTITVTFSGTVSAPMGYDMDDLENDIQASIENSYSGNSSITVDVSEDSMDIEWTEA